MLRFRGATLRAVLNEALANRCQVILVKDQGVYFMSAIGEKDKNGSHRLLAYADGCHPDLDPFGDWWERARRECGGDDFGEYFDIGDGVFQTLLSTETDLLVLVTPNHIRLSVTDPTSPTADR
ncbi:DUF3085 domain-containing protein [Burkholderia sp. F1]|uniref:DUF3085 domain-containing protein n=1 Tax=Burkholderia sp. F1 TaxID=3366817 RepID=UPI003D707939